MRVLVLEEIKDGLAQEILRVGEASIVVGREPSQGVRLASEAVSREHGVFRKFRNHWAYKDLGSTNGSWLNGEPLLPHSWKIIRPGDSLQIADIGLRARAEGEGPVASRSSLLIFQRGELLDEYPVPDVGKALVVGGSEADIEIAGDVYEQPSLVVERRGDKVVAYNVAKQISVSVNGKYLGETMSLEDGDELKVSEFAVLYNDPAASRKKGAHASLGSTEPPIPENVKEWGDEPSTPDLSPPDFLAHGGPNAKTEQRTSVKIPFGKPMDSSAMDLSGSGRPETIAIDPRDIELGSSSSRFPRGSGAGLPASSRYSSYGYEESGMYQARSVEDRIILVIGILLSLVLLLLVVWWVFV